VSTDNQSNQSAFEAGFNKVAHGIPYDGELQAMSYVQLSVLLSLCTKGSPKYLVVLREMARKANTEDAKVLISPAKNRWFERPLGMILTGIIASLVAWAILRYYGFA